MHGRKLLLVLTAAGLTLAVGTQFPGPGGRDARRVPGEREGASGRAIQSRHGGPAVGTPAASVRGHVRAQVGDVAPTIATAALAVAPHLDFRTRPLADRQILFPIGTPRGEGDLPTIARRVLDENRERLGPAAVDVVREMLLDADDEDLSFEHRTPELWIRPEGRAGRLVWRIDARTADESARVCIDALDGDVVATRDLRVGADGQAKVFQPNPVFSSHDASLRDRSDRTSAGLAAAQQLVTVRRLDGSGYVRGEWCDAARDRGRGNTLNKILDWTALSRDDDAFELINAYVQVDAVQDRLQTLGIASANASSQRIDAHALTGDQSYFDTFDDTVRFGDGGVDDAEDGDIVVHEYGHAIQDDQVPGFGSTLEGGAMGEGFSDFLAATIHATGDSVWDPLVGSWDATAYSSANPPFLRRVDGTKVYPHDVTDEPHDDGEMWSRFLWDVRSLIGTDDALRVAIAAHEYLNTNAKFLQGANAVLVANLALRDGRDDAAIRNLLRARGLPFNAAPLDPPPEDAYEQNDDAAHPAHVAIGAYPALLLADDDWFQVSVGPFRRLRAQATFDSAAMDLDLQTRTTDNQLIEGSYGVAGQESVGAVGGLDGGTFLVRALHASGDPGVAAYDLALLDLDLESVKPGRTIVRTTSGVASDAVTVSVGPEKVGSAKLIVTSVSRPGGARNDVRVVSPSGTVVADFGDGATKRGARIVVPANETGAWRIEVRARIGTSGKYTLQAKFRK
ncbi:MAG: M36 family metallopeptidase [Planctomycetes bacterium]|nr:M36 family metallopeptidase [Planctomycetota bacterium]